MSCVPESERVQSPCDTLFLPLAIFSAGVLSFTAHAAGASCDSLKSLDLKDTTITVAQTIPAGSFTQPGSSNNAPYKDLPEFCRVIATLKPTDDSDIKIEVWLPAKW